MNRSTVKAMLQDGSVECCLEYWPVSDAGLWERELLEVTLRELGIDPGEVVSLERGLLEGVLRVRIVYAKHLTWRPTFHCVEGELKPDEHKVELFKSESAGTGAGGAVMVTGGVINVDGKFEGASEKAPSTAIGLGSVDNTVHFDFPKEGGGELAKNLAGEFRKAMDAAHADLAEEEAKRFNELAQLPDLTRAFEAFDVPSEVVGERDDARADAGAVTYTGELDEEYRRVVTDDGESTEVLELPPEDLEPEPGELARGPRIPVCYEEVHMTLKRNRRKIREGEDRDRAIAAAKTKKRLRRLGLALLVAIALAALSSLSGCISKGEYRGFVDASRRFYDATRPGAVASIQSAIARGELSPQSGKNRMGAWDDYQLALEAADERIRGAR